MIWAVLFGALIICAILSAIYVVIQTHKFNVIQKLSRKNKIVSWIVASTPLLIVSCFTFINVFAAVIVLLHLVIIWILCDLIFFVIRKICRKEKLKEYYSGIISICVTVIYLSYGWFCAHYIFETNYQFNTSKDLGQDSLRIVEIADAHIGITLDGEKFSKEMKKVRESNPDIIVIVGDFVDDDTIKDDMVIACQALGELNPKFGVYFVMGNHDEGYYQYRDFSSSELRKELQKNKVIILEDEYALINDCLYIIGRRDRQNESRMDVNTLTANIDKSKYAILLDHQPNDYDAEATADIDLVLSGHTHGGHIFPAGIIGKRILKANDSVYGSEIRGNTAFVVTSGISGWGIPFKTGAISEYVVIDIFQK